MVSYHSDSGLNDIGPQRFTVLISWWNWLGRIGGMVLEEMDCWGQAQRFKKTMSSIVSLSPFLSPLCLWIQI